MADEEEVEEVEGGWTFFILPTQPGKPTTAVVGVAVQIDEDHAALLAVDQIMWSQDMGQWIGGKGPVNAEAAEMLNERCRELGIEGF